MAFTKKIISVSLGNLKITSPGDITDLRISCKISKNGDETMGNMEMSIYGLPLALMNQLTLLGPWQPNYTNENEITVKAGDSENLYEVFTGTIQTAWTDAQAMPKVSWRIYAQSGIYQAKKEHPPTSIEGNAKVKDLLQKIATDINLKLEAHGVDQQLENPYHARSAREQIREICKAAGISCMIDGKTLVAVGSKADRGGEVLLSPRTGLVGYPGFNQQGIVAKSLFNPNLLWQGIVTIQSDLTPACGRWQITNIVHELESEVPHGLWFTSIAAIRPVGSGLT